MIKDDISRLIVEIVNEQGPIKGTELITQLISQYYESGGTYKDNEIDIIRLVENAVKNEEICEVEYTLPDMNYRIKSLYFPIGTTINSIVDLKPEPFKLIETYKEAYTKANGKPVDFSITFEIGLYVFKYSEDYVHKFKKQDVLRMIRNLADRSA